MRNLPGIRTKRRRDGSVYYQIRIRGQDKHLGTNKGAARRKAAALLAEAYGDEPPAEAPLFVADLVERFRLEYPAAPNIERTDTWVRYAGTDLLAELPVDHLKLFADWMKAEGFSAWSIRGRVQYAARLCDWAFDRGWMRKVPRRPTRLPRPVEMPRDEDPELVARVLAEIERPYRYRGRARQLLEFVAGTGCRPIEARLAEWSEVNWRRGRIVLGKHKTADATGDARIIRLTPAARAILEAVPVDQRKGYLFPNRRGGHYTRLGLRNVLRRAARSLGLKLTPYQLRHMFAQTLTDRGVPDRDIAELMGHRSTRMVARYRRVRERHVDRLAADLASPLPATPVGGPPSERAKAGPSARGKARPDKCGMVPSRSA